MREHHSANRPPAGGTLIQRSKYTNWTQCAYCYWKQRLENHEPLETLLQQRNALKSKEEKVAALLEQAEAELQNHVADLNRKQPRWKKWLGITPSDERLKNLGSEVYRLQEEFSDLTRQIESLKRKVEAARHIKKRFDSASHLRAVIAENRRQAQGLKEKFDASSLSLANEMEYDRAKFKIRKKDYKRGNGCIRKFLRFSGGF